MDRGWKSFNVCVRKSLGCPQDTVHRTMGDEGNSGMGSERKEESRREGVR